ncbi:PAS domain S-box protein [Mycobacterium sp. KBS0706]|uniref:PAS domain S-box protein n=1 Tax=Mycobacterium sp. KBS0706 TaxID=2578109 RepID=UPI00110FED15|nr:PAS domain S-box protein [Mycobacterium sp. KBS0706]TSD85001.1 PAS domain S-box protein [Mycobacterium sp. KBS0706]
MNDSAGRSPGHRSPPVLPGSADLLRRIIDQAAIGMVLLDQEGRWLYTNPALCALIGYSRDECASLGVDDVIHPEERDDVHRRLDALQRGEIDGYRVERRYRRKDGSILHGLVSVSSLDAEEDSPFRYILQVIDAGPQKQAEAQLAGVTERLELALDAGGVGIFEVDFITGERLWDARTHELHGVMPDSFDRSTDGFHRLLPPEDVARVTQIHEAAERDHAVQYRVDYRVLHRMSGTTRHIRASMRLAFATDGSVLRGLGACWDITEDIERSRRLHDTLALLQAVMKGTPDLVYVKDSGGRYLLINPAVEKVMGRAGSDVIGRHDAEIFPAETAQAAAGRFVARARAAGCAVMLDDFGSGLSSFAYLRQFAVDGLKIDGGFIRQIATSAVDRAIVESINAIGHRLGAVTIAEQVEDDETLALVRAMGIDQAQGFAVERPRPLDSLF